MLRIAHLFVPVCLLAADSLQAASPIEFDVAATVAAVDVTTNEFAATHPREKLIAVRLPISVFVSPQASSQVRDYVVTFDTASAEFQVDDFFPKTTLDTRFTGPVNVRTSEAKSLAVDFDATGFYKHLTGAALTANLRDQSSSQADFQLKAPQELVAASGTIQRGRGVYFKLRPTPGETIEGSKEFLVVARVPRSWRGDAARVRCTASGDEHGFLPPLENSEAITQRDFLVGLYLEGDIEAQRLANGLVQAEQVLRDRAIAQRKQIERQATPRLLQKVGLAEPSLQAEWFNEFRFGPPSRNSLQKLPPSVRDAAIAFSAARARLHQLSSNQSTSRVVARLED